MADAPTIFLGKSSKPETLQLKLANRHGLVAGATGTGKTVTLQIMAEAFSKAGVPVFAADIKGDLSGISQAGKSKPFLHKRAEEIELTDYDFDANPVIFWDLFGKAGHPVRATISEMGPVLLAQMLQLNDTQEGVLNIAFRLADEQDMLLIDMKDLRALLVFVGENAKELSLNYGNISTASVGAIQRRLLTLEQQGAKNFFGEPALELTDLMRTTRNGRGYINILAADKLMATPRLYATFLLWLLSELFEEMPETGDPDKPKLVFFFDEAHLLFDNAPRALIEKVEQVVRLIRSKGVGVYFVTQNPADLPDAVLGQLGNRIQHALRAFTPRDRKAVKAAAETFRQNKKFDVSEAITQLGIGEALVSTLLGKGTPSVVQKTLIRPPCSRLGPATKAERKAVIESSPISGRYEKRIDRESAYELLEKRRRKRARQQEKTETEAAAAKAKAKPAARGRQRQSATEAFFKSALRTAGRTIARELVRGILGSFKR
jgi:DNA helicase HerA-like ATPase